MKSRLATFIGTKMTMSQTWDKNGNRLPVSVVAANPMVVTQIKEIEGQNTKVQVGIATKKGKKVSQSLLKHLKKNPKDSVPRYLFEITAGQSTPKVGDTIEASSVLTIGDLVSVSGTSIGHGFTGVMQRHNFAGGPRTHGQSDRARAPGSIGQGTSPGRVHKGKKMAGHHGSQTKTIRNLQIINIDKNSNQIWLNGPIPGFTSQPVLIQKTGHHDFAGLYQDHAETTTPQDKPEETKDKPAATPNNVDTKTTDVSPSDKSEASKEPSAAKPETKPEELSPPKQSSAVQPVTESSQPNTTIPDHQDPVESKSKTSEKKS